MQAKPNLDLLRSIAVALVVVDHVFLSQGVERFGRWYIGDVGLFGVYLFFVHTSLVLMWSLERRPNALDFYIRRVFRLYPLALVAVLFAAVTHAPVGGTPEHYFHAAVFSTKALILNLLLVQDLIGAEPIIHGVTWSLPPELYMYILLPCLFFYARTVRKLWPILIMWLLTALVARRSFPIEIGNNFPMLIPNFISGVIAYVGFMRRRPTLPAWTLLPLLAGIFAAYMSLHRIRADWFACLALGLVLPSIRQFKWRALNLSAHKIATYSFGVYLFHPFGIVLGMYLLAARPFAVQLAAALLSTAVAAVAGYHLIERPMIDLGARVAAKAAEERGLPSRASLDALEPAP